jgi:hypothetical protein
MKKTLLLAIILCPLLAQSGDRGDRLRRIGGFSGGGGPFDKPNIYAQTNNVALSRNRALMHAETIRRMKANQVNRLPLTQPKPATNTPAVKPVK